MLRPLPVFLATAFLTLLFALPLKQLRFDNTPESWLPASSPSLRSLETFRQRFGDGSFLLANHKGNNLSANAEAWRQLAVQLRALPGVSAVYPPPFVEEETEGPRAPITAYLASPDQRHAAFLILPKENLPLAERGLLVQRLEDFFAKAPFGPFELAGVSVITSDLDSGSRQSLSTIGPLVAFVLCLVLYLTTREWRGVGAALLVIAVASIWTLGLLSLFNRPLNLVVVTLPAIIAVVTCTQAMHTLAAFHSVDAATDRASAWAKALQLVFRPSLYCSITTTAGFLSLATSEINPVRDLGLFAAFGVGSSFLLGFTLFPALLGASSRVRPRGMGSEKTWSPARAEALTHFICRFRTPLFLAALGVFAASTYGIYKIRVDSHILDFFPPSHRIPTNYRAIEKDLLALTPIDIVFSGPRDVLLSDRALNSYRNFFTETLKSEPLARQVVSIVLEPSRDPNLEFVLSPAELREALASEDLPASLRSFLLVDKDRLTLRTTLLTTTASTSDVFQLMERLRKRLASDPVSQSVTGEITGTTPLLIEGQVLLLKTQIESFAIALAIIGATVFFAFRSVWAAVIILIPNLLPIAFTLGFMGWTGIPLNTATVTVAGIALGLIVDDSIHFLYRFQICLATGTPRERISLTLLYLARPITVTSLAIASGFALFAFSPFPPTAYFGLLLAITAAASLTSVLFLLPALLLRFPLLR